jgi:hypothetical protein
MTKKDRQKLERRVDDHTLRAMGKYADHGHGANYLLAVRSANRLVEFVVELVRKEGEGK